MIDVYVGQGIRRALDDEIGEVVRLRPGRQYDDDIERPAANLHGRGYGETVLGLLRLLHSFR